MSNEIQSVGEETSAPKREESISDERRVKPTTIKRRARGKKITLSEAGKALTMRVRGVNERAIASQLGLSQSGVAKCLKYFAPIVEELKLVDNFRQVKSDILSAAEMILLKAVCSKDKIAKATLNNVAFAYTQINNANRLERGQSTENRVTFIKYDLNITNNPQTIDITEPTE